MVVVVWGVFVVFFSAACIAAKHARDAARTLKARVDELQAEVTALKDAVVSMQTHSDDELTFNKDEEECSPQRVIAELHASLSAPRRRLELTEWNDE